jgi:hypothetical protein
MTKEEKFIAAIIEEIDSFNTGQLVQLNNIYCDGAGYPDDQIYSNDANFFADYFSGNIMEAVRAVSYGDYTYTHDWVRINGYGNLETMQYLDSGDLCESVDTIAEHVAENFSDYDYLFNLDPDSFDEETEEEETDEDDDTHLEP